jgi:putative sigma-54 modulation protein
MKFNIQARGMSLTDAMREHVEDKVGKLDKMLPGEIEVHVILSHESARQGATHTAEVNFRVWDHDLVSKNEGEDLYKAITEVSEQLSKQLRRLKEKRVSQRKGGATVRTMDEGIEETESIEEIDAVPSTTPSA